MATFTVPVDTTLLPGLAGPNCTRAEVTTYEDSTQARQRPLNSSHYCTIDCFRADNSLIGRGYMDSGQQTLGQAWRGGTLDAMLLDAFGG